jgi:ABC-2 type transport system permease protein
MTGKVRSGEFDFFLIRPISPLFRSLVGSPDFNDVILFVPLVIFSGWYISTAIPNLTVQHLLLYLLLLGNGLLISLSFHIFVICMGIISAEIDNTIMLYRDLTQMGRFPMEIYREPLRGLLTFVVPIGVMMAVPSKVLLGLASGPLLLVSCLIGVSIFGLSLCAWNFSLKKYTSDSS